MKIIYGLISDKEGQHFCYKPENAIKWMIPSITQCHNLNPDCEIIIITDNSYLKEYLPFVKFYHVNDYIDDDIKWFNQNYIHLSTNQYNFEKNAIIRYMLLKNFCFINDINNFLHLEPDVLVFSKVIEDSKFFEKYNVTLLNKMAAGCCFFNNAKDVFEKFVGYVKNSYSIPQRDPRGFNMEEEKIRYKYNIDNNIGFGGVSDMNYWSLYNYLYNSVSYEQMDTEIDNVIYQTCMMITPDNTNNWESIIENTEGVFNTKIKKLDIKNNNCYGVFNEKEVRIKYLHCHGHTKLLIPKYNIK